MKLYRFSPSQLQTLEAGQFIIRYISDFNSLELASAEDPVFLALHNSLLAQSPIYNLALSQMQAKAQSEKLREQDIRRAKKLTTLRRALGLHEHTDDSYEKEAYSHIKIILNNCKGLGKRNFEAETLGIDNLIADLCSGGNLSFIQILNMVPYVDNLEMANAEFKTTFNARASENISTIVYDTKALKKEILARYKDLAEYVLVMAKRKDTPYYKDILSAINNGREYYSNILARRKGWNSPMLEPSLKPEFDYSEESLIAESKGEY